MEVVDGQMLRFLTILERVKYKNLFKVRKEKKSISAIHAYFLIYAVSIEKIILICQKCNAHITPGLG